MNVNTFHARFCLTHWRCSNFPLIGYCQHPTPCWVPWLQLENTNRWKGLHCAICCLLWKAKMCQCVNWIPKKYIIIVIVVVVIITIMYLLIIKKIINIPYIYPPPPPHLPNLLFMCLETPNFITQIKIIVIAACNVLISHVKLPLSRVVEGYRAWWPLLPTFSSPGTRKC